MGKGSEKEGLQVIVRVRPPISSEVKLANVVTTSGSNLNVSSDKTQISCAYDKVFGENCDQAEVFECVKPLLNDILQGINGTVFAYGHTSAGKSHTMLGPNGGADIMKTSKSKWAGELSYSVKASFLQIYNETVYDLLRGSELEKRMKEEEDDEKQNGISDRANEVYVAGLSEFRVTTAEDVLQLVAAGTSNRAMRSTDFNATSSRSHAVLQLSFEIQQHSRSGETVISHSKLSMADLAGSEKILTNYVKTRHLRELTSINTSLSCLGNVIAALTNKNRTHIPYRDSKLTRLLQDSLGGNTRTIFMACVAPTDMHTNESVNTLQFADRARGVMLKVKANTVVDDKAALGRANSEIIRLQNLLASALAKLEGKGSQSPLKSSELSNGDSNEAYINGTESGIEFYIKENARLREEVFELRTMFGQNHASKAKQKSNKQNNTSENPRMNENESSPLDHEFDELDRTKESDLSRANKKKRRGRKKNESSGPSGDNTLREDKDNSRLVLRFRQASQHDSKALSSSGTSTKIYGSSVSSKNVRKLRNSFEDNDELGETNREYFSGFLSSVEPPVSGTTADTTKTMQTNTNSNPYTSKSKGSSKSARRGDSANKNKGKDPKLSSTSPSRMRIEKERSHLQNAYNSAQDQLQEEKIVLDNLTAQRLFLERQLNEVAQQQNLDSIGGGSVVDNSSEAKIHNLPIANMRIDNNNSFSSDEQCDSQEFVPLSLDGASSDAKIMQPQGFSTKNSDDTSDDKENYAQGQKPNVKRGIADILTPKKKAGGAHANHLRENIQQASSTQALPSPTKMKQNEKDMTNNTMFELHAPPPAVVVRKGRQISTQGLYYAAEDIGRELQQFSFRHNDWLDMRIIGYDDEAGVHQVLSTDGKASVIDLKKKPVRLFV
eukprot:GSChrysophyteH2.ASY1.ANO1.260.1 assembled CDS